MDADYQNVENSTIRQRCWGRFRAERHLGPFELVESNGQVIDVQRSFAAQPFWVVVMVKFILTGLSVDTLVRDLIFYDENTKYFYFAYLTHWGLLIAVLNMLFSFINTIMPYPEQPVRGIPTTIFVKLAWAFFPLAATLEAVIVMLYWKVDFQAGTEVNYIGYMKHGGVFVIVLLEGLIVDRVPVRLCHLVYPMIVAICYLIWTLVHGLLARIGNPHKNDTTGDDDAIYEAINWEERPESTLIICLVTLGMLVPLSFLGVYLLSLPFRRYVNGGNGMGLLAIFRTPHDKQTTSLLVV